MTSRLFFINKLIKLFEDWTLFKNGECLAAMSAKHVAGIWAKMFYVKYIYSLYNIQTLFMFVLYHTLFASALTQIHNYRAGLSLLNFMAFFL